MSKKWTEREDKKLVKLKNLGRANSFIAIEFGRSVKSIENRITVIGAGVRKGSNSERASQRKKGDGNTVPFKRGMKVNPVMALNRVGPDKLHLEGVRDCDHSGCLNQTRGRYCVDHALEGHRAVPTHIARGRAGLDDNVARYG